MRHLAIALVAVNALLGGGLLLRHEARDSAVAVAGLVATAPPGRHAGEVLVPLESQNGLWVVSVILHGGLTARFIVDTGAALTILSPALAARLELSGKPDRIELELPSGRSEGKAVTLPSLTVGGFEQRQVRAVIHETINGAGGILGNNFLARFRLTLDGERRLLRLEPLGANHAVQPGLRLPCPPTTPTAGGQEPARRAGL